MTFLNVILLAGLAAAAIPIIIHILNRRRARVLDWGAMMFLEQSLASRSRRILLEELLLMLLRCALLAVLALALARPFLKAGAFFGGDSRNAQDIAVVVDGSLSMTVQRDGRSNFDRAVEEARQVVQSAGRGDAVSVILAGPTAESVVETPVSDKQILHAALDGLSAAGGSMSVPGALGAAVSSLAEGSNPAKKIVLITDGQRIGWDLEAERRWSFLQRAADDLRTPPLLIARALPTGGPLRNLCVTGMSFSRAVVGTDRPVSVTVTVANTGAGLVDPKAVELLIDGATFESRPLGPVAEGAAGSVVFEPRFDRPGPHVLTARIGGGDDLAGDDECTRALDVVADLPVLILEGRPSSGPLAAAAGYLASALQPDPEGDPAAARDVVSVRIVAAADVAQAVQRPADYPAIVLAAVPRLPQQQAAELVDYVVNGGGLLVAPGEGAADPAAVRDFYNNWKAPDGTRLLGVELGGILPAGGEGPGTDPEASAHIEIASLHHPALKTLADPRAGDLADARIRRHWQFVSVGPEESASVVARLDTGHPLLAERKLGRGRVMTLAVPPDMTFSDLPMTESFTPLAQELIFHLAAPSRHPLNLLPGQQFVCSLPADQPPAEATVIGPDGRSAAARIEQRQGHWLAAYAMTARPGLYRLTTQPAGAAAAGEVGIPFVVTTDPDESRLEMLADQDYERAGGFLDLARAETLSQLTTAIEGGVAGSEISATLVLIALALLAAEVALARHIALKRKAHEARPMAFGAEQVDAEHFREAAGEAGRRLAVAGETAP